MLGRRGLAAGADDLVPGRVLEVAADQGVDLAVQRGREQQPLGVAVGLVEQLLDDREEAQVGHEVGLVQHGDDDLGEARLALADQVLQPAGGGDDDVDAAAELLDLAVHGGTAVDGGQLDADGLAEGGQGVVHLLGQLTGRDEDQATRGAAALLGVGADAGEQRQAEGQRLARAGGGLAEHVAAGEGVRQGGRLDGERVADAAALERRHQRLGQAQLVEGRAGRARRGLGGVLRWWCSRRAVLSDVLGRVGLERDRVDQSHAGWGSDTARSASRGKGGRGRCAGVLTGDHLRPGMERGICTDALMPGQTVREDDRPLCRYAQVSSEDRSGIPRSGVCSRHPLGPAGRRIRAGRRRRAAASGRRPRRIRRPARAR